MSAPFPAAPLPRLQGADGAGLLGLLGGGRSGPARPNVALALHVLRHYAGSIDTVQGTSLLPGPSPPAPLMCKGRVGKGGLERTFAWTSCGWQ